MTVHGAAGRAVVALSAEPDLVRRLPKHCPYGWNEIWHRDVLAEAGIDLSVGAEQGQRARRRKRNA